PGGVEKNTPQSYTGYEPAARRAISHDFDPYRQTRSRIEQLEQIGHATDKIDFIVMGGTFTSRDPYYQRWFIKRCFDGMNGFESKDLEEAKRRNERAKSRCIGLTIETRPDWCRIQHIDAMLEFGATRVELGVQTVYDSILYEIKRGHTTTDTILATMLAKDAGLKVCYHMMPGLPGSDMDKDFDSFRLIFEDPRFRPDMLKIYPTLVIEGTELYNMWKEGAYKPLTTDEAIRLIAKIKTIIPEWVRIQRIERDVPSNKIDAGIRESNLRQLVHEYMEKIGKRCRCIRCREAGRSGTDIDEFRIDDVKLIKREYEASNGNEVFLSLERKDILFAYLRLRLPFAPYRYELRDESCMIIRELKVVGRELPINARSKFAIQHRGFGKMLVEEAEKICREEFDCKKLFVLSGIGVKDYYRRLGFKDDGIYLSKNV
ncbi:MAG TPA: tRNA uridine(34) 5-carboxymethylaminomethyl modification radical SAM/GNAT enzyme Elp3, partial [Thermoplasmatales archaeon]|nr:tRNA uridine(34) 5-carboxymethylaminomethyl modification radical SAM/GNAT enzyme Elp3 [Thermoplasmatales archaeon]